ncbi:MAG: class E sortase [Actinobacteria bacterium]|nr:class E sortase [Actinomycetota bacterium]MCL5888039.1 class E sortase [Actinomycetota bacterium]
MKSDLEQAAGSATQNRARIRVIALAASNVLLGFSAGLLLYYLLTDVLNRFEQWELQAEFPARADTLPVPDPSPADPIDLVGWDEQDLRFWTEQAEGASFGRLIIERIDLDQVVVKGHSRDVLRRGPGWIDYTDVPGETGNVGIAGHRTTFGAPFRRLDEVRVGDILELQSPYRSYRYSVAEVFRVTPDRVDVMRPTDEPTLTLSACDPPFSADYRLIVQARLVEVTKF